jgi:hypothetical protein
MFLLVVLTICAVLGLFEAQRCRGGLRSTGVESLCL